jgi:hypothetical protein
MNMTPQIRFSISVLVELCYDMAQDAFADEPTADHFFMDVLRVAEWLEGQGMRTPKRPLGTPPPSTTPPSGEGTKAKPDEVAPAHQAPENARYRYECSPDGCEWTFHIYAPGQERPFTIIAFWQADERTEVFARRVVASLNACEGVPIEALEQGVTVAKK